MGQVSLLAFLVFFVFRWCCFPSITTCYMVLLFATITTCFLLCKNLGAPFDGMVKFGVMGEAAIASPVVVF